jgi:hypothetical protein
MGGNTIKKKARKKMAEREKKIRVFRKIFDIVGCFLYHHWYHFWSVDLRDCGVS